MKLGSCRYVYRVYILLYKVPCIPLNVLLAAELRLQVGRLFSSVRVAERIEAAKAWASGEAVLKVLKKL